jgi:predicted phage-related endonuclease
MAVTGYSRAYVAAIVGGNSYYCHVVERDEEYIENLVKKEADFWKCVEEGKMPEADESEATAEYLNNRYGCSKTSEIELPASAEDLIHEYISADEQIKTLNSRKTGLANKLKAMMQDNEIGRAGDNKVIWSTVSRQNLDKDKLKNDLGSAYDKYVSETSYRRFSVA